MGVGSESMLPRPRIATGSTCRLSLWKDAKISGPTISASKPLLILPIPCSLRRCRRVTPPRGRGFDTAHAPRQAPLDSWAEG